MSAMESQTPQTTPRRPARVPVAFRIPAELRTSVIDAAKLLDETPTAFIERAIRREVAHVTRTPDALPAAQGSTPKGDGSSPATTQAPLVRRDVTPRPKGGK